jgi:hypothetical protein
MAFPLDGGRKAYAFRTREHVYDPRAHPARGTGDNCFNHGKLLIDREDTKRNAARS